MRTRILKNFVIVLISLSLTGCWDLVEINELILITLVGVDRIDNNVSFVLEYKPPRSQTGKTENNGGGKTSQIVEGTGYSLSDARTDYLRKSNNDTFLGAIRGIVFSESFAENGIEEYMNRVRGIAEYRKTVGLYTTNTKLDKLFDAKELNTDNVGLDIESLSNQLFKNGLIDKTTTLMILEASTVQNTGYPLTHLDIVNKKIEVSGYSVFKNNKKIGFIPIDKVKGFNYLIMKKPQGEYSLDFMGMLIGVSTRLKKRNIKVYYSNEKITFDIKISIGCEILQRSETISIDNEKMKDLEEKIADKVKEDIVDAIETSQIKYGCDYLYLYKYFRAKYNSDFRSMNWNEEYKDAEFNIDVKAKMLPGSLINFN